MKIPLLLLGQSHFKCSSLFTRSSERTNVVSWQRISFVLSISGYCGVLNWCLLVEKRGDNSAHIMQNCSHLKFILSNLCEQCTIRILVEVRN